jgi:hypothetical protein
MKRRVKQDRMGRPNPHPKGSVNTDNKVWGNMNDKKPSNKGKDVKKKQVQPDPKSFGKHLDKHVGKGINDKIDKGGKYAQDKLKEGVGKGSKYLIDKGVDKNLVNHGSRELVKSGSRLIREGTGKAKHWIHTEGKRIAKDGINKIAEGGRKVGEKIKGKWNEFTGRFKKR